MLTSEKHHHFSIVLPLYNPSGTWVEQFLKNTTHLQELIPSNCSVQYIIVYDGNPGSDIYQSLGRILDACPNSRLVCYSSNMGKGYALRQGVRLAETPYVLVTDFDFPYKKENIVSLMKALISGHDVVAGKRSDDYFRSLPFKRKIISRLCVKLQRTFLDLPLYDTQSGIKGFNRKGMGVFLETTVNRFLVDTEFILRAHNKGLSIRQLPIELETGVTFSNFGVRVIRTEMNNFLKLVRLNKKLAKIPAA